MTVQRVVPAVVVAVLVLALGATGMLMRPHAHAWSAAASPRSLEFAAAVQPVQQTAARADSLVADPTWVARTSAASGLPQTAVAAYGDATLRLAHEQPACHLGWTTLAGVGTVESANGTVGGRTLLPDGRSDTPISGPALDGIGGYAALRSAGGWARALGPMQFLASTWQQWGADGDGDGRADIDDLFDAALAAGRYLCADGHQLGTPAGWTAAIRSYNHSDAYVRAVYDAAEAAAR